MTAPENCVTRRITVPLPSGIVFPDISCPLKIIYFLLFLKSTLALRRENRPSHDFHSTHVLQYLSILFLLLGYFWAHLETEPMDWSFHCCFITLPLTHENHKPHKFSWTQEQSWTGKRNETLCVLYLLCIPKGRIFWEHSILSKTHIHKQNWAGSTQKPTKCDYFEPLFGPDLSSPVPQLLGNNFTVVTCIGGFEGLRFRIRPPQVFKGSASCTL